VTGPGATAVGSRDSSLLQNRKRNRFRGASMRSAIATGITDEDDQCAVYENSGEMRAYQQHKLSFSRNNHRLGCGNGASDQASSQDLVCCMVANVYPCPRHRYQR
jgi:hypothetical protein